MWEGTYSSRGEGEQLFGGQGGDDEVEEFKLLRRAN